MRRTFIGLLAQQVGVVVQELFLVTEVGDLFLSRSRVGHDGKVLKGVRVGFSMNMLIVCIWRRFKQAKADLTD